MKRSSQEPASHGIQQKQFAIKSKAELDTAPQVDTESTSLVVE